MFNPFTIAPTSLSSLFFVFGRYGCVLFGGAALRRGLRLLREATEYRDS
jgi:hypothetical protein